MDYIQFYFSITFTGFFYVNFLIFVKNPVLNLIFTLQLYWNRSLKYFLLWELCTNSSEMYLFFQFCLGQILKANLPDCHISTYSFPDKFLLSSPNTHRGGSSVTRSYWMYRRMPENKKKLQNGGKGKKATKHQAGQQAKAANKLPRELSTNGPRPAKDPAHSLSLLSEEDEQGYMDLGGAQEQKGMETNLDTTNACLIARRLSSQQLVDASLSGLPTRDHRGHHDEQRGPGDHRSDHPDTPSAGRQNHADSGQPISSSRGTRPTPTGTMGRTQSQ